MKWHFTSSKYRPKQLQKCLCLQNVKTRYSRCFIRILRYRYIEELNKEYWEDDDNLYEFSVFDAWAELKEIEDDYLEQYEDKG